MQVEQAEIARLGKIPSGWRTTTLGEIGEYINGRGFKKSEWAKSGLPIIRIQDLTGTGKEQNHFQGNVDERHVVNPGDLLISWAATLGAYIWRGPKAVLNQHIFKVRSFVDRKFHYYLIQYILSELYRQTHGSGMVHITKSKFDAVPVVVPETGDDQRGVVAEIEKAFSRHDEAVANLKRVKANLKRYKAAVLKAAVEGRLTEEWRKQHPDVEPASELLKRILAERRARWSRKADYKEPASLDSSELGAVPRGWAWAGLEQLTSAERVICYGILMPKEHVPNGVLYVKVKDMKGDRVDVGSLQRTSPKIAAAYARASLKTGDLLLAIRGTYGRVAEVPAELDGGNITQDTARLDVSSLVDHRYVAIHLRSQVSQGFFRRVARGVAVKGVNIGDVRLTPIAVPPVNEQKHIVAEVDRRVSVIDELESVVCANLVRAERWRQSALTQAFNGRLLS